VTRAHITWKGVKDENRQVLDTLEGEEGPVRTLILYNAALRLSLADETAPLVESVERVDQTLRSGAALELLDRLCRTGFVGYKEPLKAARLSKRSARSPRTSPKERTSLEYEDFLDEVRQRSGPMSRDEAAAAAGGYMGALRERLPEDARGGLAKHLPEELAERLEGEGE
jgi:hypothetical protein